MMISLILQTATRLMMPLFLVFSVFLMLRGHDEPGGGFIGGLVGAAAFALYSVAFDLETARRALRLDPHLLIGIGLFLATVSGLPAVFLLEPYLTAVWLEVPVPGFGLVKLSTVLIFDIGVYLTVVGATLLIVFALMEE